MTRIRVVTWNVHGFAGIDGTVDIERTGAALRSLDADLVGIQEVDLSRKLPDGSDRLRRLESVTGLSATFGPTRQTPHGAFGNAILTRLPVTNIVRTDVSVQPWEPRGILSADVDVTGTRLRVAVTHFGLRRAERLVQLAGLEELIGIDGDDPVLLLGDFNEWRRRGRTVARLNAIFGRSPAVRSFPSRLPLFALDRIWARPSALLSGLSACRTPAVRTASDHLPVQAVLEIRQ